MRRHQLHTLVTADTQEIIRDKWWDEMTRPVQLNEAPSILESDVELQSMVYITYMLSQLPDASRTRVLNYAQARFSPRVTFENVPMVNDR